MLVSTTNDAVITIDEASLVIDWNQAAERMFGWTAAEALGHREFVMTKLYRSA